MVFATIFLSLMSFLGVLPDDHLEQIRPREVFWFTACSSMQMFILLPNLVYLIVFHASEEVYGLTDLMYTIILFSGVLNGYRIVFLRQISIRDLINELKRVVAESEYLNRFPSDSSESRLNHCHSCTEESTPGKYIYAATASQVDRLCHSYVMCAIVGNLGVFVMPYAKPLYYFLAGKYSFASWYTPYKTM